MDSSSGPSPQSLTLASQTQDIAPQFFDLVSMAYIFRLYLLCSKAVAIELITRFEGGKSKSWVSDLGCRAPTIPKSFARPCSILARAVSAKCIVVPRVQSIQSAIAVQYA